MDPAKSLESLFLQVQIGDNETLPALTNELQRLTSSQETVNLLFQIIQNPTNQSTLDASFLYLYKWTVALYRTLTIPQKYEFLMHILEILKTKPPAKNRNFLINILKFALNRTVFFKPLLDWIIEPSEAPEDATYKMVIADTLYELIPENYIAENHPYFIEVISNLLTCSIDISDKINLLHLFGIALIFFKQNNPDSAPERLSLLFEQANAVLGIIETLPNNDQLAFASIYGGLCSNNPEILESLLSDIQQIIQKPTINGQVKCVFLTFICDLFQQEIFDEEHEFSIVNDLFNVLAESYDDDEIAFIDVIFSNLSPLSLANVQNYILEMCKEAVSNESSAYQYASLEMIYYSYKYFYMLRDEFYSLFMESVFPNLLNDDIDDSFISISLKLLEYVIVATENPCTEHLVELLPLAFSESAQNRSDYGNLIFNISSKQMKILQPVLVNFINHYVEGQCEPEISLISVFGHLVYGSFSKSDDETNEELVAHIVELSQLFYAAATESEELLPTVISSFAEIVSALPQTFEVLITPLLPFFAENFSAMIENEYNDPETYFLILDFIFRVITSIENVDNPLFTQEPIVQFLQWNLENTFQNIYLESVSFSIRMIYATVCQITEIIPHILTQVFAFFEDLRYEEIVSICPFFPKFCRTIAENDVVKIILNLFKFYQQIDEYEEQITLLNSAASLLDLTTAESYEILDPKITEMVGVMLEKSSESITYFSIACSLLLYGLKRQTENSLTFLHFITETMYPTFNPPYYDCYYELLFDCAEIHALPDEFLPELIEPITSSFELFSDGCRQTIACLLNRIIAIYNNGLELFSEIAMATRQWTETENEFVLENIASLYLTIASKVDSFDPSLLSFALEHYPPSDHEEIVPMSNMILQIHFPP